MSTRLEVVHKPMKGLYEATSGYPGEVPDVSGMVLYKAPPNMDIYVTGELQDEIDGIEDHGGFRASLLFHATNSLALGGLGKSGAILSAKSLIEQGEDIQTGEYSMEIGEARRQRKDGLSDVYVSQNPTNTNYCFVGEGQKDQFPIIFGIGGEAANTTLKKRWLYSSGYEFRVPEKIGLDNVKSMIVPAENMTEAQEWISASRYCRDALVLSLEAARAITLGRSV